MHTKILIVGDAGRGKTTFAEKISQKTGIPFYSTDDFYWKVKFTERNKKEKSLEDIKKIYESNQWIVDGSTRGLIQEGIEKAEIIYLLEFDNLLPQYFFLIARHVKRDNERFIDLWELLKHVTSLSLNKSGKQYPLLKDMLKPYEAKVVRLTTLKKINERLREFEVD